MIHRVGRGLLGCGFVLLLLTGCDSPEGKDDVKQVSHADARTLVDGYLRQVISAVGGTPNAEPDFLPSPCEGQRGELSEFIYSMRGGAQLPLPEAEQLGTLARLRDSWRQQGYTIVEDRTFPDGKSGTVVVRSPADGVRIAVDSTSPATALAIRVSTPCYQSDVPL
jgi:hypothetical protein